jgi:hypothetical protein
LNDDYYPQLSAELQNTAAESLLDGGKSYHRN